MKRFACALLLALLPPGTALGQERYFDSAGVRIRYIDQGTGPAIMLVHGFTATIETSWIDTGVLPDLAHDHRVIALDLRGHGKSDKPRDPRAYDELGMDLVRLLDHLGIERAHVVGYSLGAIIVAKLLTTHPQRFLSAVLGGAAYRRSQGEAARA
jgi:pimeloyl-ACP methyl ester carboxylesterase